MTYSTKVALTVGACLAAVLAGMGWLTVAALRLDAAARESQFRAWKEERVQAALWRIDSALASVLAEQNARPAGTFLDGGPSQESVAGSGDRPDYVAATFQVDAGGDVALGRADPATARWLRAPKRWDHAEALLTRLPAPLPWATEPGELALNAPPARGTNRAATEYVQRRQLVTQNAAVATQAFNNRFPSGAIRVGRMEPHWIDDRLVLLRQIDRGGRAAVQGIVLDWDSLRGRLTEAVSDTLPSAQLVPVVGKPPAEESNVGDDAKEADRAWTDEREAEARRLAALPARLIPGEIPASLLPGDSQSLSVGPWPVAWTLAAIWIGALLALTAVVVLILGVVRLSERRAAFVGTVTHELRTPLTTLRMYAEMIEADMVSPADRSAYLGTLRREADRLSRLVENVLSYARLERRRSRPNQQTLTVDDLVDRIWPRLEERAGEVDQTPAIVVSAEARKMTLRTDPEAVEQILFNLVDNACKYADGKPIEVRVEPMASRLGFVVRDHGPGLPPEVRRTLFRPFSKAATGPAASVPGVGLGLALSRRLAQHLGGRLEHRELDGPGACFVLELPMLPTKVRSDTQGRGVQEPSVQGRGAEISD